VTTSTFVSVPMVGLSVDADRRTIEGVVVPYNATTGLKNGARYRFARGSLKWPELGRVKLLRDHDVTRAIGKATALEDTPEGLRGRFKVSAGADGDAALLLAADGVTDGLSAGLDFYGDDTQRLSDGVTLVRRADLREVSLTAMPAFDNARVTRVAASRRDTEMSEATETTTTEPAAEPAAPVSFTLDQIRQVRELFAADGSAPADAQRVELERPTAVNPTVRPIPTSTSRPADDDERRPAHKVRSSSLMPDDEQVEELRQAVLNRAPVRIEVDSRPLETFAVVSTTDTGRTVDYLRGRAGLNPIRIADLVGLTQVVVGPGGDLAFPIFGAGAAGTVAEGGAKPEYDAVSAGQETPDVVAVWTDMTDQAQSIEGFESKLRNRLARLIAIEENDNLRTSAQAGANTQAFTAGNQDVQILRAAASIQAALGVTPDLLLYNPADTATIFGNSVSNASPQEIAELSVRMFGMLSLPLSGQAAGHVLVGAWAAASTLAVGRGLTYQTDPFTGMKNNVVTLLGEIQTALAVEEPTAFTDVDIVTP
jgi:HK97 family phage prohead protease